MPGFLEDPRLRLVIFGGKGGCGKTTSAASAALSLVRLRPRARILVASCDPAHSLGDALGCPLGSEATSVPGTGNLYAQELDAEGLDRDFRKRHGATVREILERGTYLDSDDVRELAALPLPGAEEVTAILWIARALDADEYDLILLDTAPTGHSLRLLAMPQQLEGWRRVLGLMQAKHRHISFALAGGHRKDEADRFLETMEIDLRRVGALLQDPTTCEFVPVTIPETLCMLETERLIEHLHGYGIAVKSVVLNRMEAGHAECAFCQSRREAQQDCLGPSLKVLAPYNLIKVPLMPEGVKGQEQLMSYADYLWQKAGLNLPLGDPIPKVLGDRRKDSVLSPDQLQASHPSSARRPGSERCWGLEEWPDIKFLFFGGKGGVGKTSLAAAASLHLARRQPSRRILVLSTDPAHSLSDSFGCELGDKARPIPGFTNLEGMEIDAAKRFATFKERYKKLAEGAFDHFLEAGVDPSFDREIAEEIGALLPPGLEEIMALSEILDFEKAGRFPTDIGGGTSSRYRSVGDYGLYVFDTAPTGHLLRFLRMPGLIRQWIERALKLLLKYRKAAGSEKLVLEMIGLSKKVKKIERLFSDPKQSECVAVTIPEAMPVLETERLLLELAKLKFPCRHVAVNMVQGKNDCSFCSSRIRNQEVHMRRIRVWNSGRAIATLPLWPRPVRGLKMLEEVSQVLFHEEE